MGRVLYADEMIGGPAVIVSVRVIFVVLLERSRLSPCRLAK